LGWKLRARAGARGASKATHRYNAGRRTLTTCTHHPPPTGHPVLRLLLVLLLLLLHADADGAPPLQLPGCATPRGGRPACHAHMMHACMRACQRVCVPFSFNHIPCRACRTPHAHHRPHGPSDTRTHVCPFSPPPPNTHRKLRRVLDGARCRVPRNGLIRAHTHARTGVRARAARVCVRVCVRVRLRPHPLAACPPVVPCDVAERK
jgi:hypothetical protein